MESELTLWQSLKPFIKLFLFLLCIGMISVITVTITFTIMGFKDLGILAVYFILIITISSYIGYMLRETKKDEHQQS